MWMGSDMGKRKKLTGQLHACTREIRRMGNARGVANIRRSPRVWCPNFAHARACACRTHTRIFHRSTKLYTTCSLAIKCLISWKKKKTVKTWNIKAQQSSPSTAKAGNWSGSLGLFQQPQPQSEGSKWRQTCWRILVVSKTPVYLSWVWTLSWSNSPGIICSLGRIHLVLIKSQKEECKKHFKWPAMERFPFDASDRSS